MIFKQNDTIGPYTVVFPIKKGAYAESYRVRDAAKSIYYLKLINYALLDKSQFTKDGNSLEIEIGRQLSHTNILRYHESADISINGGKYCYIIFDFISGETKSLMTSLTVLYKVWHAFSPTRTRPIFVIVC